MIIKHVPEEFVVDEVMDINLYESGKYAIFTLKKKNWTTTKAIKQLAFRLRKNPKSFAVSGMKDKDAITTQYVSAYGLSKKEIEWVKIKDIELKFLGYSDSPIGLSMHSGNYFEIVARDLDKPLSKLDSFCNYYDDQRFGGIRPNTALVGEKLLQRDFEGAMKTYLLNPFSTESKEHKDFRKKLEKGWGSFDSDLVPGYLIEKVVVEHLEKHPEDYFGAFKKLPKQILTLFIHSYQSRLFNEILDKYVRENFDNYEIDYCMGKLAMTSVMVKMKIPLIGYDFKIGGNLKEIIGDVLGKAGIEPKDFKFEGASFLSSRTVYRDASAVVKDLELSEAEDDELNRGKLKQEVKFSLGPGSYATMLVKAMEK